MPGVLFPGTGKTIGCVLGPVTQACGRPTPPHPSYSPVEPVGLVSLHSPMQKPPPLSRPPAGFWRSPRAREALRAACPPASQDLRGPSELQVPAKCPWGDSQKDRKSASRTTLHFASLWPDSVLLFLSQGSMLFSRLQIEKGRERGRPPQQCSTTCGVSPGVAVLPCGARAQAPGLTCGQVCAHWVRLCPGPRPSAVDWPELPLCEGFLMGVLHRDRGGWGGACQAGCPLSACCCVGSE